MLSIRFSIFRIGKNPLQYFVVLGRYCSACSDDLPLVLEHVRLIILGVGEPSVTPFFSPEKENKTKPCQFQAPVFVSSLITLLYASTLKYQYLDLLHQKYTALFQQVEWMLFSDHEWLFFIFSPLWLQLVPSNHITYLYIEAVRRPFMDLVNTGIIRNLSGLIIPIF
jgi:TctA family transporter